MKYDKSTLTNHTFHVLNRPKVLESGRYRFVWRIVKTSKTIHSSKDLGTKWSICSDITLHFFLFSVIVGEVILD